MGLLPDFLAKWVPDTPPLFSKTYDKRRWRVSELERPGEVGMDPWVADFIGLCYGILLLAKAYHEIKKD